MGWYNGGNWDGLGGDEIPIVLAEIANAISERYDCIGLARPSIPTPASGSKTSGFVAADYVGMALHKTTYLTHLFDALDDLNYGIGATPKFIGWARDPAEGVGPSDYITINVAAGEHETATGEPCAFTGIEHALDGRWYRAMRVGLDALVYPVHGIGILLGWDGATGTYEADRRYNVVAGEMIGGVYYPGETTATAAYLAKGEYTETPRGSGQPRVSSQIRALATWENFNTSSGWDDKPHVFCDQAHTARTEVVVEAMNPSNSLRGESVRQFLVAMVYGRHCAAYSASALSVTFNGDSEVDETDALILREEEVAGVAINERTEFELVLGADGYAFSGSQTVTRFIGFPLELQTETVEGVGDCAVYMYFRYKRDADESPSFPEGVDALVVGVGPYVESSGAKASRVYMDIRGELDDQA